jgi:hypothetical protein
MVLFSLLWLEYFVMKLKGHNESAIGCAARADRAWQLMASFGRDNRPNTPSFPTDTLLSTATSMCERLVQPVWGYSFMQR